MIIRVWVCRLKLGVEKAFEQFALNEALPTLRKTEGCVDAYVGIDSTSDQSTAVVVSVWRDLEAIKSFTGGNWREPYVHPLEAPLLAEKPRVSHFNVVGKL
ncbi:MAG: antibiotic biosynthesis monooxygenase [Candidatus Caldarchaeum sp.]|nr:antibiotic biosynthesis monooxygenase [Candidatus Caldarchaeum sp.]